MVALPIRNDVSSAELRRQARRECNPRAASRMYAIANALDGMSRAEAARAAGMERQALRDAVVRYNAEGLSGLYDRPKGHPPKRLNSQQEEQLIALLVIGPDPERDGVSAWTREDIARLIAERFGKSYHPSSLSRVLKRLGFSRQKARPSHPKSDREAQEAFKKGGSGRP